QERDWETMIDGSQILITRKWDAVTGQMWEEWRNSNVKQNFHLFVVTYRVYTLTELENLLFKAGFNLVNAFGNFMGSELTYKSRWMVVQSVKV
ncbi:MAG: hypothetical protein RMK89_14165, partial [Armatimonadota bacterium]|nr:hypothetical protein [Armatimonadota bacterium]MDW8144589.1 hypothetical protein [Armatimonadota bacterium]